MSATARPLRMLDLGELERFDAKVDRAPGGCWTWTGAKRNGYGMFWLDGGNAPAHRIALLMSGVAVPEELVVDHTCRNRACVNPSHLRAVSRFTNVHENSQAPGHLNSLKTHCRRGHPLAGDNLAMDGGRRRCRTCKAATLREMRMKRKTERLGPEGEERGARQGMRPKESEREAPSVQESDNYFAQRLERSLEDLPDAEYLTLHRHFLAGCARALRQDATARALLTQSSAPQVVEPDEYLGLPFSEAKARILAMPADVAQQFAISLMTQNSGLKKYEPLLLSGASAPSVQVPECVGDPGECAFNGACMYKCSGAAPSVRVEGIDEMAMQARAAAAQASAQPAEPVAHICILPNGAGVPTKFLTSPDDPCGFPVYTLAAQAAAEPVAREWHFEGVPPAGSTCLVWVKPPLAAPLIYAVDKYDADIGEGWHSWGDDEVLAWSLLDEAGPLATPTPPSPTASAGDGAQEQQP